MTSITTSNEIDPNQIHGSAGFQELQIDENEQESSSYVSETSTRNLAFIETSSESLFQESILAVSYRDSKIGAAHYHFGSSRIDLLHEMYEFDDFTVLIKILCKFMPSNVVVTTNCKSKMFHFLKKFSTNYSTLQQQSFSLHDSREDIQNENNNNNNNNSCLNREGEFSTSNNDENNEEYSFMVDDSTLNNIVMNRYKLHLIPSRSFTYDECKSRILSINFPKISHISDKTERYIYLTSYINFFEVNTIKSLGMLLYFIQKRFVAQKPISDAQLNSLSNFVYFDLDHFLSMDQLTFEALDIFQCEWHPSISKKGLAKKESFTLFGIFNSCMSKIGSSYLRKLFLQPIADYTCLEERFSIIEFFTNPNHFSLKQSINHSLKNIKDITGAVNRLRSMNFILNDFCLLHQVLFSVISIRNLIVNNLMFNAVSKPSIIFDNICIQFTKELDETFDCIEKTIDLKKSKDDGKIKIRTGIDQHLDRLKFYFNKMTDILKTVLNNDDSVKELVEKYGLHISIIYLPQLGFLLKLLLVETQRVENFDSFGFELIFCANDSVYYRNAKTKEFDRLFGDILSEIDDCTHKNLILIKDFILKRIDVLLCAINFCAYLDAMIAMAQTAIDHGFIKPKITCSGTIKIHQGRHPLYELITNSFVPNDYYSDDSQSKALAIFGSNGSGKTVYLKQVCLIIYLAHIGSYVPAKYAEISLLDKMFTRIRTPESISTLMSAFKLNLNQMIDATKNAKRRSLVVIDLFGKSTLQCDGFALLEACLNYWLSKNNDQIPHLLISTQFTRIGRLTQNPKVRCYLFENINGVCNYQLQPFQQTNHDGEIPLSLNSGTIPELIGITNMIQDQMEKNQLIEKRQQKQKNYLRLADMILSANHSNCLKEIETFIQTEILSDIINS